MSKQKGVCLFAYNNDQLDYGHFALLAAKQAKTNLQTPVSLITNEGTWAWLNESHDKVMVDEYIDDVVITKDKEAKNIRKHWDSPYATFTANFINNNKHKIWEYSPYQTTLLIDIDYMIRTDYLGKFWGNEGVTMFDRARTLRNELMAPKERYLYDAGVPMWWSTVIMFDRTDLSKMFFDIWAHVADNYGFYQYIYNFPGKLFRTDYCVSIAVHMMNGMTNGEVINNFDAPLVNMLQQDDFVEVQKNNDWIFLGNDRKEEWKNILVKSTNQDVHCMNKRALQRHWEDIMGVGNE